MKDVFWDLDDNPRALDGLKLLAVGDLMLDRTFDNVRHVENPTIEHQPHETPDFLEAPAAPVHCPAGVATTALAWGAFGQSKICGVVGASAGTIDLEAQRLGALLKQRNIVAELIPEEGRQTIVKHRFNMDPNHYASLKSIRIDQEGPHERQNVGQEAHDLILRFVRDNITWSHAVVINDFEKGVVTPELVSAVSQLCREHNKRLLVDPKHGWKKYRNVTADVICPNWDEAQKGFEDLASCGAPQDAVRLLGGLRRFCPGGGQS